MGEIILRHFFNERGLGDQVNVESSGVSDEEWSHPIDPRAVRVLRERGYGDEIPRDHFAHRISREEIDRTDLFLPMTASHMRALLRIRESGNADRSVRKKNSGESGNAGRSVLKKSGGKGSGKSCRTEAGQIGRWNCQKARRSSERKIKGDVKKEKETKTGSI